MKRRTRKKKKKKVNSSAYNAQGQQTHFNPTTNLPAVDGQKGGFMTVYRLYTDTIKIPDGKRRGKKPT